MTTAFILGLLIVYLISAIPFGYVIVKMALGYDVRTIGSHGTGATNVNRTGRSDLAAITLVLDAAKPILGYFAAIAIFPELATAATFKFWVAPLAVLAHIFPVYLRFNGGKGVATAWGTMFMFNAIFAIVAFSTWLFVLKVLGKSSLAAIVAMFATPVWAYIFCGADIMLLYMIIIPILLCTHYNNIKRLFLGAEDNVKLLKKKK